MKLDSTILFDYTTETTNLPPQVLIRVAGYLTYHDKKNRNDRVYPFPFWETVINGTPRIAEMVDTKTLFGATRHPYKDEQRMPVIESTSHNIVSLKVDKVGVYGVIDVLDTPAGRIVNTLLRYGSKLGMSTRAYGDEKEVNGAMVPILESYYLVTWDFVTFPAFADVRPEAISDSAMKAFELEHGKDLVDNIIVSIPESVSACLSDSVDFKAPKGLYDQVMKLQKDVAELRDQKTVPANVVFQPRGYTRLSLEDSVKQADESLKKNIEDLHSKLLQQNSLVDESKSHINLLEAENSRLQKENETLKEVSQLSDEVQSRVKLLDSEIEITRKTLNDEVELKNLLTIKLTEAEAQLAFAQSELQDSLKREEEYSDLLDSAVADLEIKDKTPSGPNFQFLENPKDKPNDKALNDSNDGKRPVLNNQNSSRSRIQVLKQLNK